VVVIELGGNDGLRGKPPQMIQNNLAQLIQLSQKNKATVLLFGMKIPPNYGTAYSAAFEKNYQVISQQYKIKLLPFFLDGVAGHKNLIQNDQIHPNAKAQPMLLNLAYPYIKGAL
jgi:acyl-CoA thioesterase-1